MSTWTKTNGCKKADWTKGITKVDFAQLVDERINWTSDSVDGGYIHEVTEKYRVDIKVDNDCFVDLTVFVNGKDNANDFWKKYHGKDYIDTVVALADDGWYFENNVLVIGG